MRKLALLLAVLTLVLPGLAQIRVLVVDETGSLEESLRLLAAVRALKASGAFSFQALSKFPTEPWTGLPFQAVIYLPSQSPYIWLSVPWPESRLPREFRLAISALRQAFSQAFLSLREVRGPEEDLYPWLLSIFFFSRGYLGGG